jgi:hypothetical protein
MYSNKSDLSVLAPQDRCQNVVELFARLVKEAGLLCFKRGVSNKPAGGFLDRKCLAWIDCDFRYLITEFNPTLILSVG